MGTHNAGRRLRHFGVAVVLGTAIACGSDNGNPMQPGGGPGTSGATITISNNAVSPANVTINAGESVTFVNNDNREHEMASNPHPAHTDCPAINALGNLQPGQSRLTNALTTSRTCGFHDHRNESTASLMGTITIR